MPLNENSDRGGVGLLDDLADEAGARQLLAWEREGGCWRGGESQMDLVGHESQEDRLEARQFLVESDGDGGNDAAGSSTLGDDERAELQRLREENLLLKSDAEILRRAARILAQASKP